MSLPQWKADVSIRGLSPLILHNGRTANPLDKYSKKLKEYTSKRKKTDEDHEKILSLQWEASLYWSGEIGLYMPTQNLLASLLRAARKHKMGPMISGFVFEERLGFPINTPGGESFESLQADPDNKFVKTVSIQRSKTISCRAIFSDWSINWGFLVDTSILGTENVALILETMASRIGLGVWTPSHPSPGIYGRFLIESLNFTNTETGESDGYSIKK